MEEKKTQVDEKKKDKMRREWVDGPEFNFDSVVSGAEMKSTIKFSNKSITFRSLSSAKVEEIGDKYDMIGFSANRAFNQEMLARSIVDFNGSPIKGDTIEDKIETLKNMPDAIFDLFLALHQEFRARIQRLITAENIDAF